MVPFIVDEPVKAGAVFSAADVGLKWFIWSNRKYQIKKQPIPGGSRIVHFAVT